MEGGRTDSVLGINVDLSKEDQLADREKWKGRNMLGKALQAVRGQLLEEMSVLP